MANKDSSKKIPKLDLGEKYMFLRGATDPAYFNVYTRPMLYHKCNNDPEIVHDLVLDILHKNPNVSKILLPFFKVPEDLKITVNSIEVAPFGTAAGMDKNGEALAAFGRIFGFQEPGTIILNERKGNLKPKNMLRVAAIERDLDLINSQGFPSKGLENFQNNIHQYRARGGEATIYASICGLPLSEKDAAQTAMREMSVLLAKLRPYVDGFVWNPFSPNTEALKILRNPQVFYDTSRLMKELAPDKLRLVKIGPYEEEETNFAIRLVKMFIEGGGHGVVTTNTKMVRVDSIQSSEAHNFGFPFAGRSGRFLEDYRLRSVKDIRKEFPNSVIIATGGIFNARDAYNTFISGANMIEGYTPYTYYGPGLLRRMVSGVSEMMKENGYRNLKELQDKSKYRITKLSLDN